MAPWKESVVLVRDLVTVKTLKQLYDLKRVLELKQKKAPRRAKKE